MTQISTNIPPASCVAAVLSILPLAGVSEANGNLAFSLSAPLAIVACILGIAGLIVARRYALSAAGILLGGAVLLFWGFHLLRAILIVQTSLP